MAFLSASVISIRIRFQVFVAAGRDALGELQALLRATPSCGQEAMCGLWEVMPGWVRVPRNAVVKSVMNMT